MISSEMRSFLKKLGCSQGAIYESCSQRLAIMVGGVHPYSYKDFEGVIPGGIIDRQVIVG
jgi:hypothetical protein